jgi:hypothetical protein
LRFVWLCSYDATDPLALDHLRPLLRKLLFFFFFSFSISFTSLPTPSNTTTKKHHFNIKCFFFEKKKDSFWTRGGISLIVLACKSDKEELKNATNPLKAAELVNVYGTGISFLPFLFSLKTKNDEN